ncbi:hypothetical protein AVEN_22426-1, partial [Araneus ventricosus]
KPHPVSGHKINLQKFKEYTEETSELYVQLYPWYLMSPTMHKILIHGPIVIENAILPIGQLSEEAAEARSKHFRSLVKIEPENFPDFLVPGCSQQIAFEFGPSINGYETHDKEKVKIILKRDFRDVTANGIF